MSRSKRHSILSASVWLAVILFSLFRPVVVLAQETPESAKTGVEDVDKFVAAGAEAYLVWLFSGVRSNPIDNDQFSFYLGDDTCKLLKKAADKYPNVLIGANIYRLGERYKDSTMDGGQRPVPAAQLGELRAQCGARIVRFFSHKGYNSPSDGAEAVKAIAANGMKAIVALHDFSSLGASMETLKFFQPERYAADKQNAIDVAKEIMKRGLSNSVYTLEISNEPHCGMEQACLDGYLKWIEDVSSALRGAGWNGGISVGQSASVGVGSKPGLGYEESNKVANITHMSGHHYDEISVQDNLAAAGIAQRLKKPFYIGEANLKPERHEKPFVYAGIEDLLWRKGTLAAKDLASRYMLICAPSFFMKAEISNVNETIDDPKVVGFDTLVKYCAPRKQNPAYYNGGGEESAQCYFDPVSKKLVVGEEKAIHGNFPLYRFGSGPLVPEYRTVSFEAFFGANVSKYGTPGYTFLNTSPVRRLQPRGTNCREVVQYMRVAEALCKPETQASISPKSVVPASELISANRDECPLNTSAAGKSLFKTWDELRKTVDQMNAGLPPYLKLSYEDYCTTSTETTTDNKLVDEILEFQPTTFNAFKKAYLVYYNPSFEKDKGAMNLSVSDKILGSTDIETFFRYHDRVKDPDRIDPAVHIIPLLVPSSVFVRKDDFQGLGENTTFQGSFARTMDILLPNEVTKRRTEQKAFDVANILGQMRNANNDPLDGCLGGRPYLVNTGQKDYSGCYNPLDNKPAIEKDAALGGPNARVSALRRSFQDILTRRINLGIRNGELEVVMGKTPPENGEEYSAKCAEYPTEVTSALVNDVNGFNHSIVFENMVELQARARVAGDTPKEKYGVRSYLLLPEDYRNVRDAEVDFLTIFLPNDQMNKLLKLNTQREEESPLAGGAPSASQPTNGGTAQADAPKKGTRFLRMSGLMPKLMGFGVNDLPKTFLKPFKPPPSCFDSQGKLLCYPDTVTMTPDIVEDNESKQFNPMVPGGVLARGIFELMAHVLAPLGSKNYQEYYCGLENYWIGTPCTSLEAETVGETVAATTITDVCVNIWPTTAEAKRLGEELKAILGTQEQKDLWNRYFRRPPGTPYLFETLPECGNKKCYEFVIDRAVATTLNDGTSINPYLAIAIALNETGGLRSDKPDRSGNHFGCGVDSTGHVKPDTIPNKLTCMVNAIKSYKDTRNLDNTAALKRYGYADGGRDLMTRMHLVNKNYDMSCKIPASGR